MREAGWWQAGAPVRSEEPTPEPGVQQPQVQPWASLAIPHVFGGVRASVILISPSVCPMWLPRSVPGSLLVLPQSSRKPSFHPVPVGTSASGGKAGQSQPGPPPCNPAPLACALFNLSQELVKVTHTGKVSIFLLSSVSGAGGVCSNPRQPLPVPQQEQGQGRDLSHPQCSPDTASTGECKHIPLASEQETTEEGPLPAWKDHLCLLDAAAAKGSGGTEGLGFGGNLVSQSAPFGAQAPVPALQPPAKCHSRPDDERTGLKYLFPGHMWRSGRQGSWPGACPLGFSFTTSFPQGNGGDRQHLHVHLGRYTFQPQGSCPFRSQAWEVPNCMEFSSPNQPGWPQPYSPWNE